MSDTVYLGNPNLKRSNVQVEFTAEQISEYLKCKNDPVYFAKNYIKIVSLLMRVKFLSQCIRSRRS